jgi:transcriptional regulator of acetoin/glycerol metabolism
MLARVAECQLKDDQSVQINTEVTNDVLPSHPTPLDFGLSVEAVRQVGNGEGGKIIPIAELEKQAILSAVAELNGDKQQAARLLGIGKTTLYRKLRHYVSQAWSC